MFAPSVLEYARSHGLAIDHTTGNLSKRLSHLPLILPENDAELPDPDFSPFDDELVEPKLQLGRRAGTILAESIRRPHHVIDWAECLPDPHRVRMLKITEPLLAGDHETDVRRFRRDASSHLDTEQLLEMCPLIDSASDENFEDEWNSIHSGNAVKQLDKEIEDERCHTTKEALVHLSAILRDTLRDESKDEILNSFLPLTQKPRARSLTPVLMMEEQSPQPYIPSSPDLEFPFRSDQDVDFDNLLLQTDREMQEKERIRYDEVIGVSSTQVKQVVQEVRAMPEVKLDQVLGFEPIFPSYAARQARQRLENLKFDVPILSSSSFLEETARDMTSNWGTSPTRSTPTKPEQALNINSLTRNSDDSPNSEFRPDLESIGRVLGGRRSTSFDQFLLPSAIEPEDDDFEDASDVEVSEELLRLTDAAGNGVHAMLEAEAIGIPEGFLKHPVPQLDGLTIRAPWANQKDNLFASGFENIRLIPTTEADIQKEKRLNWQAIPDDFMRLGLIDKIEEEGKCHKWLEPSQGVARSDQLIFKKPGLRVLDTEDESDEELVEDIDLHVEMNKSVMSTIPTKRFESPPGSRVKFPAKKLCVSKTNDKQGMYISKNSLNSTLGSFSTSNALETFLDLRGGRFKKAAAVQPPSADELVDDPIQPTQPEENNGYNPYAISGAEPIHARTNSTATTVQVPSTPDQYACHLDKEDGPQLVELEWSRTVVVETSILQGYGPLINFLETCGNDRLNIVYREMHKIGGETCLSAVPDVILNPRAALIFTNLQALNQRSLPGQVTAGQSLVQNRILKLVLDFDRLFVLVSTPKLNGTMLQAQVDTITASTGFCASLSSNGDIAVTPIWVTSGADSGAIDEALNRWTWKLVSQHAFPETDPAQHIQQLIDSVPLINDETIWEQFLRRTGLNPMAAQVVLGSLKRLDPPGENSTENWGLRRLVRMAPDERSGLFAETLGLRIMQRLNDVLGGSRG